MKTYLFIVLICLGIGSSALVLGETYKGAKNGIEKPDGSVTALNKSAALAARMIGSKPGVASITCDHSFIQCSCKGAIDCAWLALACGEAGGIQGFDGDCFFPSSVPGANDAIKNFTNRVKRTHAQENKP